MRSLATVRPHPANKVVISSWELTSTADEWVFPLKIAEPGRRVWPNLILSAVTLTAIAMAALPLFPHRSLAYYVDDFFYYLQIAHNLVDHGRSTFDGTTLTNGYHPLWLLILAAFYFCGGDQGVFVGVGVLIVTATVSTYLITQKLLCRYSINSVIAAFWAAWAALFALSMDRTGMEVILAVPLLLAFVLFVDGEDYLVAPRSTVWAGLLAALVILSRLDTVLLLVLYFGGLLLTRHRWLLLRRVPWICLGLAPVFVYAATNLWFFGSLGPVSSSAKHLQPGYTFSAKTLESLFHPLGLVAMAFLVPAVLLIGAGFIYGLMHRRQPVLFWVMLVFTPIYLVVLSVSSDWGLWIWYRYPFIVSAIAGLLLLRGLLAGWSWAQYIFVPAAFVLCALFCVGLRKTPENTEVVDLALQLKNFAAGHPGIYGMGDSAGTPAVVIGQPIVQLEGLVMDKKFLNDIRQQRNLLAVLKEYRVRYYVSTNAALSGKGCFDLSEPKVAGLRSPHMRATLCRAPVDTFQAGEFRVWVFDLQ